MCWIKTTENTRGLQKTSLHSLDQILYPGNGDDDEESDSEEEEHDVDGPKEVPVFDDEDTKEPKEEDHDDPGLLGRIAQSFMNKFPVLQTRSGRAGRVHNFLRGLGLAFAPVPSGRPPLLVDLKLKANILLNQC